MTHMPSCGHPQCAGEAFCGYTGQPVTMLPIPKSGGGKALWIVGGVVVVVLVAAFFGRNFLISGAVSTYQATQPKTFSSRAREIRFPGWSAGMPVEVVTIPDGGFDDLGLEPVVGRFINSADGATDPPVVVIREEIAEVVQRGIRDLREAQPDRAPEVPTSQDFVGREIELSGRRMVIAGVAGKRPVTSSTFRSGLSADSAIVYLPGLPRP